MNRIIIFKIVLVFCLSSCGTTSSIMEAGSEKVDHGYSRSPIIYGGIRADAKWFLKAKSSGGVHYSFSGCVDSAGCMALPPLIDLPISLIADTALLPVTIPWMIHNDYFNSNQLIFYVKIGDLENVKKSLLKSHIDQNAMSTEGNALHYAVKRKEKEIFDHLLTGNIDLNRQNKWGNTPLHEAAINCDRYLMDRLITKGARTDIKNNDSNTAPEIFKKCK